MIVLGVVLSLTIPRTTSIIETICIHICKSFVAEKMMKKLLILFFCLLFCLLVSKGIKHTTDLHKNNLLKEKELAQNASMEYNKFSEITIDDLPYNIRNYSSATDYIGEPIIIGNDLYFYFYNIISQSGTQGGLIVKYDILTGKMISSSEIIQSNNVIWDENYYAYAESVGNIYLHKFESNETMVIYNNGEKIFLEKLSKNIIVYTSIMNYNKQFHIYDLHKQIEILVDLDDDAFLLTIDNDEVYFAYSNLDKGITIVSAESGHVNNYPINLPSKNIESPNLHANNRSAIIINDKLYATLTADDYNGIKKYRQLVRLIQKDKMFDIELLEYNSEQNLQDRTFFEIYSYNNRCLFELSHISNDNLREFSLCELNCDTGEISKIEKIKYSNEKNFCLYKNILCVYNLDMIDNDVRIYLRIYEINSK